MTYDKMIYVRNTVMSIFTIYLLLLIMDKFIYSAFYLSLFINFSNRYLLFALAYFLICRNLYKYKKEKRVFLYLFITILILTLAPIYFYVFDVKEFDLNDPLSSLTYINIALHMISIYTILFSVKIIKTLNSTRMRKKKFFYLPHIIYMTLIVLYVAVDFEIITINPYYLDGIGLLGAIVLMRSITRFQYVIIE